MLARRCYSEPSVGKSICFDFRFTREEITWYQQMDRPERKEWPNGNVAVVVSRVEQACPCPAPILLFRQSRLGPAVASPGQVTRDARGP
jgi:hypothetical protein